MEDSDWLKPVVDGIRDVGAVGDDIARDVGCNVERSDWLRRGDVDAGARRPGGAPIARIHPCTSLRLLGSCR